ncbi:hypothetical protein [Rathayibacter sp. VKM Ac-2630]|uniref:hypothetical protein n=1 Tax=Rathayibacter sp. VKM Ac-2630 TaxID=1938617 RepID=UPI000982560B|nr:hypothetical protein [Rathayibacter sp. VKM Ac-2630]OOB91437.1 hypothetical protein B0T42_06170 [Rathayibacter sp. VKM Ac-2630]
MDEPAHDELRALQRRAYGRGPDLAPGEWSRLRALEAAAAPRSGPVSRGPVAEAAPVATEDPFGETDPAPPDAAPGTPRSASARLPRLLLRAAALVAAALLGAGVTTLAAGSDSREVATLRLAPADDLAGWGGSEDTLASDDFHGLRVVKRPSGEDGGSCLYVVPAESDASGIVYSGCSARSFPATAQLTVSPSLPSELRDAFGDGSGLRFVLAGETVHVSSDR